MLKNKKVLITGANGFIDSHLTERLVKEGAKVRALAQYNSFNNWGWLEYVDCKDDIEVLCGDIRDLICDILQKVLVAWFIERFRERYGKTPK